MPRVTNLLTYLAQDAARLRECTSMIKVLKVNQRTLDLFAAATQEELVVRLGDVFRDDMHGQVAHELNQLWEGKSWLSNQTVNYALDGRRLDVQIGAVCCRATKTAGTGCWCRWRTSRRRPKPPPCWRAASGMLATCLASPVSLWVEDFSAVKRLLDEVRNQGIEDSDFHQGAPRICHAVYGKRFASSM